MGSADYELMKYNLRIYNRYLYQDIGNGNDYYAHEFTKYKGEGENEHMCGAQNIANEFNEFFTNIRLDQPRSINTSNKAPLDSYLDTPCSNSFFFRYTNPTDIVKVICQLKPKSSAGYINISSRLLK